MPERPAGMAAIAAALLLLNIATPLMHEVYPANPPVPGSRAIFLLIALIGFVIIRYFWKGRNWARWVVMIQAALAVLNPLIEASSRIATGMYLYMMAQAAFGLFLLFWLNRPEVRAWFQRSAP